MASPTWSEHSLRNHVLPNGNPTVPKVQGDFKRIDIIRIFVHSVGEFTPLRWVPLGAEAIIRESDISLEEAQDYLAIGRIYTFYLEFAPVVRFYSPDEFFFDRLPALPQGKGIFDFMDPAITPLHKIEWPDLEEIYRVCSITAVEHN
ncbi:hypothetical protein FIBSPDRAFT_895596 [Athelia psychrophila]|uniref:Uncharacterized protein n=1 Tax=Athelia psychrophila TaxID=1759441 RepID=A0A166EHS8_9AGAM|nr:hypothetical protein FIBSPDRAFT_895596 [Fibularhizoctonia sp. CBS 109695]